MSAANGTQRDIGLDLTRILAFLAVPSVHFFLNSTYSDTAIVGPRLALMTVMRTAFMVCVPLYMLLSGYLSAEKHIPLTRSGLLGYYKKLLPIFLTYALSTGVILLYRVLWLGEEQTIRSAVKNLLSFQQYSWYMNMYFGLLLLTPFLNALWQSLATPAARRALLAVLLVLTVLPGMVNIYNLHSAETLLHPWLSTSYDQLVPDWWQRLYPITYYFLGGYLRAHVDIKRLRTGRLAALLLLAVLCFGKVMLVDRLLMGNPSVTVWVDVTVCLTLCVTVLVAKIVGCSLPLIAKRLGFDPAVMASPFITTIVDAMSLLLYFFFAKILLGV